MIGMAIAVATTIALIVKLKSEAGGKHRADDDDGGNGVGDGHQRRVQGRRDGPDHVVADVDRQHEDDEIGNGMTDFHEAP
jgi:hypothetical protein